MLISKKLLENFPIKLCMFLLPFTLPIGIAVTEFFVISLTTYFFYKNRNYKIFANKIIIFLIIFSIYIAFNSIIQISYFDFNLSSVFHFRFILFSLSIYFILKNTEQNFYEKKILFIIFPLVIGFIIVDSLIQFFYGKNILGNDIVFGRVSSIFLDELILGSFFVKLLPFFLWLFFFTNIELKKFRLFLVIFITLIFIVIYISGERSAFILLFVTTVLIVFFIKDLRKIFTISLLILSLFIIISSVFSFGKTDTYKRVFVKTYKQIFQGKNLQNFEDNQILGNQSKTKLKKIYIFSKDHEGHYILAFDLFLKSPVFGFGPEGFRSECRKMNYDSKIGMCSTHPHNIFLQFLSELGLFGLFFYIGGFVYIFSKMFKIKRQNINSNIRNCLYLSSIGIFINLFPFLPSGSFFNNWISILLYYYIGLYLFSFNKCILK